MKDPDDKKPARPTIDGLPARLFDFMPIPGKCRCGADVANLRGDEFEKYACAEHVPDRRAAAAKEAREKYERAARVMRDHVTDRVDAAIPATYDTMRVVGEVDEEAAMLAISERIKVVNVPAFLGTLISAAQAILTTRGTVVLFAGPTGVGKSHAVALLLRYVASLVPLLPVHDNPTTRKGGGGIFSETWEGEGSDPYVLWKSARQLFREVTRDGLDTEPFEKVAICALDDIGGEGSQVNATPVQDILWARYDDSRAVIASTGFVNEHVDPSDVDAFLAPLAARYDKAFVRRLAKVPQRVRIIPMLPPAG